MSTGTQAAKAAVRRVMHVGSIGMLFGGFLMFVGSIMPWVSVLGLNISGMSGAGLVTLATGAIALAGGLVPQTFFGREVRQHSVAMWHAFASGGIAAAIVLWQLARLVQISAATDAWGEVLPGIGLILVGGASIFVLRAGFRLRNAD